MKRPLTLYQPVMEGNPLVQGHTYLRTHDLEAEHMLLDIGEAVAELHGEASPGQSRRAVTLVKQGGLSLVLTHLHAGGSLQEQPDLAGCDDRPVVVGKLHGLRLLEAVPDAPDCLD